MRAIALSDTGLYVVHLGSGLICAVNPDSNRWSPLELGPDNFDSLPDDVTWYDLDRSDAAEVDRALQDVLDRGFKVEYQHLGNAQHGAGGMFAGKTSKGKAISRKQVIAIKTKAKKGKGAAKSSKKKSAAAPGTTNTTLPPASTTPAATPSPGAGAVAGGTPEQQHAVVSAMDGMQQDERNALDAGYAVAAKAGFTGTPQDYFIQQVALYQHAQEGDHRLGTYFYGPTLTAVMNSPAKALVDAAVAQQTAPQSGVHA